MNERALRVLEYHTVLGMLKEHATSQLGKSLCEALRPESNVEEIRSRQQETAEATGMCLQMGNPPIGPIYDQKEALKLAQIGGCLTIKALLEIADGLRTARNLKKFISASGERYPRLSEMASLLAPHLELEKHVEQCIIGENQISDHASPELRRIRKSIASKNEAIRNKLESMITSTAYQKYLQDPLVTIRQDRFVIPVKSEYKQQVKGLVHDQSAKGSTLYIEPMAVVELNNALKALLIQEQKEIERILFMLSGEVAAVAPAIGINIDVLARLDFWFAKGKLAVATRAIEPDISERQSLRIKNGRHPMLPKEAVVPTNVWLGETFTTLLITGPNTGGKTVTLKTVGLLTVMAQSGLHVPADYGTTLAVFDEVFADIGDEQSIEQSLSTFSSHMTNIVSILEAVTPRSLVLFDELGAGTDPTEGAALAVSILEQLRHQGIRTMATTHYSELKAYAIVTEGVENASAEFDVETLSPTYRLLIGIPGKSNAFEISRKLGLSESVIDAARQHVHQDDVRLEDVIASVERTRKSAEAEQDEAIRLRLEVEILRNRLKDKEDKWLEQKNAMASRAKEEARDILRRAKEASEQIISELRGMKHANTAEANRAIETMRKRLGEELDSVSDSAIDADAINAYAPETVAIGDSVRVLSINQEGTVVSLPNDRGELQVQIGLMKMTTQLKQLSLIGKQHSAPRERCQAQTFSAASAAIKTELDVRGNTTEDAILIVDKYLDDAVMSSLESVRIIHGKGTGMLRKGLHEHFKRHPHVKTFELAAYNEGGSGATVVHIK